MRIRPDRMCANTAEARMFRLGLPLAVLWFLLTSKAWADTSLSCRVVKAGDGEITVSWNASPSLRSFLVTGTPLNLYGGHPTCRPQGSANSCTVRHLIAGVEYSFSLQANNHGHHQQTVVKRCGVSQPGGTSVPGTATITSGTPGPSQVDLIWSIPTTPTVTRYTVQVSTTPNGPWGSTQGTCSSVVAPLTRCTATGLTDGTPYYFIVTGHNGAGTGSPSAAYGPVTPVDVPDRPVIMSATPGDTQAGITWRAPLDTGGSPILGYIMQVGPSPFGPFIDAQGTCAPAALATQTSPLACTSTGLTNGATYYVQVAAINAIGTGLYSEPEQVIPVGPPQPIAAPDVYHVAQGATLIIPAAGNPGVLDNDTLAAGASLASQPSHGQLVFDSHGGFTYQPDPAFAGTDTFQYVAVNGSAQSTQTTVSIVVEPNALPPVAHSDIYSTPQDTPLLVQSIGVLANDASPIGLPLSVQLTSPAKHGRVAYNPDGGFRYHPRAGFTGTDTFQYRATDGSLSSAATTVTITVNSVNHPPQGQYDTFSTAQDTKLYIAGAGVLTNDMDPDNDPITSIIASQPAHGSIALAPNGGFTYLPTTGYSGTDSFTYVATDGTMISAPVTVTLMVTPTIINQPPVGNPDSFSVAQGSTLLVSQTDGVLKNDFDPEGHPLTRKVLSVPTHGIFMPFTNGGFIYTPSPAFSGNDSFTYEISDGTLTTGPISVAIQVTPVIQKPLANPDAWLLTQDTTLQVQPADGLLVNDLDPQHSSLTVLQASSPGHGSLHLINGGGFSYVPNPGYSGPDSFTYTVGNGVLSSDPATVFLTVIPTAVNRPPVANSDSWTVQRDRVLSVPDPGVLANDYDPDGQTLQFQPQSQPSYGVVSTLPGGGFTYTPQAGFVGNDSFFYLVTDGALNSSLALVQIKVVEKLNPPKKPVPVDYKIPSGTKLVVPNTTPQSLKKAKKASTPPAHLVIVTPPTHGAVTPSGQTGITYTPDPGYAGPDRIVVLTDNGSNKSPTTAIDVKVNPADRNDPPRTQPHTYGRTGSNTVISSNGLGLLDFASDPNGNPLTPIIVTYPAHGLLKMQQNGEFLYYPEAGFKGKDRFTWKVTDGQQESNVSTMTLNCAPCGNGCTNNCNRNE